MNLIEYYNITSLSSILEEDHHLLLDGKASTKVRFICPEHGIYVQSVSDHFRKDGRNTKCPVCSRKNRKLNTPTLKDKYQIADESVIVPEDRHFIHQNGVSTHTKIRFICPEHGIYTQSVKDYFRKDKPSRCPICGRSKRASNMHATVRASEGGLVGHYSGSDYSMINEPYKSMFLRNELTALSIVECTCKEHGIYYKRIGDLLGSKLSGCPTCAKQVSTYGSRMELKLVDYLNSIGIEAYKSVIPKTAYELDVYMPEYKLAVEVNGSYWHSDNYINAKANKNYTGKTYHKLKTDLCNECGITLLHFHYGELEYKWDICINKIKSLCGKLQRQKVFARKCEVVILDKETRKECLSKWHIQGDAKGKTYGLIYNDKILAVMGWRRGSVEGTYELNRYATDPEYFVVGGFAKLEAAFVKEYKPSQIISYADLRISRGDLYYKENYQCIGQTDPDYQVIDHLGIPRHKFNYRKERFKTDESLKYEEGLTEFELEDLNRLYRVWNCGMKKFVKNFKYDSTISQT